MKPRQAKTAPLRTLMSEASESYQEGKAAAAKAQLQQVAELARAAGLRSATLLVNQAMTLEALEDSEGAFRALCEAVILDPLSPRCNDHFGTLAKTLRRTLAGTSRERAEEATPRLYALLSDVGETDAPCQVALARYRLASGDHPAAIALLDALTLVQPSFAEAWTLRAEIALRQGDSTAWETFTRRARDAQLERGLASSPAVN